MTDPLSRSLGTVVEVVIIGKVFPWKYEGGPCLVELDGSGRRFLPLFDDEEQLETFAEECTESGDFEWDCVKRVRSWEFLEAFKGTDVRPITNIHMVDGHLRYAMCPVDGEVLH